MVGSFYDPELDEGCAFEELISFHGGLGGPQTRAFILHPATLPVPDEPIIGAAARERLLRGWRASLQVAQVQIGCTDPARGRRHLRRHDRDQGEDRGVRPRRAGAAGHDELGRRSGSVGEPPACS